MSDTTPHTRKGAVAAAEGDSLTNSPSAAVATVSAPLDAPKERDAEWLRQAGLGNTEAFRALVEQYQRPLLSYAFRMLGDRTQAEDVVQDAFLALHGECGKGTVVRNVAALLYRIVTNRCLNTRRNRARRREVSLDAAGSSRQGESTALGLGTALSTSDPSGLGEADAAVLRELLLTELDELPERQRAAWVLKVVEQRPYAEVAELLEVTINNAEVLVHRAGKRLAESVALRQFFNAK